jgi:hypothetical protein
MVQEVFIALELCYFAEVEGLKSHFFFITIIKNKYFLHNIKWETNVYCIILIRNKYPL